MATPQTAWGRMAEILFAPAGLAMPGEYLPIRVIRGKSVCQAFLKSKKLVRWSEEINSAYSAF